LFSSPRRTASGVAPGYYQVFAPVESGAVESINTRETVKTSNNRFSISPVLGLNDSEFQVVRGFHHRPGRSRHFVPVNSQAFFVRPEIYANELSVSHLL